jgi:hypothetical protein
MTPDEGAYFCGVGSEYVFNRDMIMEHLNICVNAKLKISGANAEVAPGQWEYQLGAADPLTVSDDLWIARWFMERLSERYNVTINYDAKLNKSYNGSGCHMNFSTPTLSVGVFVCRGDACVLARRIIIVCFFISVYNIVLRRATTRVCPYGKRVKKRHLNLFGFNLIGLFANQSADIFAFFFFPFLPTYFSAAFNNCTHFSFVQNRKSSSKCQPPHIRSLKMTQ